MDCSPVGKCHNTESFVAELGDPPPEPYSGICLLFLSLRVFDDADAPLPVDIGALAHDFIIEIGGERIGRAGHKSHPCVSNSIPR